MSSLDGIKLECEAPAKGSYTPDLILVNRARHTAYILDLKRSLASYGDTSRLEELKLKMMASAMVLPDWLYKHHKRMLVDTVEVAIVEAPAPERSCDRHLGPVGDRRSSGNRRVAACMAELRLRFGRRVQQLLEVEARKAVGVVAPIVSDAAATTTVLGKPLIALNGSFRTYEEERAMAAQDEDNGHDHLGCFDEDHDDEPEPIRNPGRLCPPSAPALTPRQPNGTDRGRA